MLDSSRSATVEQQDEIVHYYFGKDTTMAVAQPQVYSTTEPMHADVPLLPSLHGTQTTVHSTDADGAALPALVSVRDEKGSIYGAESYRSDVQVIREGHPPQLCNPVQRVVVNPHTGAKQYESGYTQRMVTTASQDVQESSQQTSPETYVVNRQMSQLTQGRKASTMSRKLTQMSQLAIDYPGPQMLQYFNALELEAAISCGRIYAPPNASFVPGEVVKRAQMVTLYDSGMIPTFENELEINAFPKPINPEDMLESYQQQQQETEVLPEVEEKPKSFTESLLLKKVHQARRKMQCC